MPHSLLHHSCTEREKERERSYEQASKSVCVCVFERDVDRMVDVKVGDVLSNSSSGRNQQLAGLSSLIPHIMKPLFSFSWVL